MTAKVDKRNDGSDLENLVRKIEQSLAGSDYSVEVRKKIFEDGIPVAEFDLILSGQVGSVPVRYLFEMRDRPSQGPQGRSWVEQLIGRRAAEKFDGIVAVSTTGFSGPAESLAKREKITLRTVRSASDLAEGIQLISFRVTNPEITPCGTFRIVPVHAEDTEWLLSEPTFQTRNLYFRESSSFVEKRFYNFILDNLPAGFDQELEEERFVRINIVGPIEIRASERTVIAKEIDGVVRFKKGNIFGKMVAMRDYIGGTEVLGQHVSVLFEAPIGPIRTDFTFAFKGDAVTMQLLDVDWPEA